MKLGIILSVVLVVVLGGFYFAMTYSPPDQPTSATSESKLIAVALPAGLPAMFEPTEVSKDANAAYAEVFTYYQDHFEDFIKNRQVIAEPDTTSATRLTDLLITASRARKVSKPFLDDIVPMKPGGEPPHDAFAVIQQVALGVAARNHESGNTGYAIDATKAVFALGQRAFENSTRYYNRWNGVVAMTDAGGQLASWSENDPTLMEKLTAWDPAIKKISDSWVPKVGKIVKTLRPQIGDLINVARNDKDLTFRVEATLQLGVAKFNPKTRGNLKAINSAIEDAKASEESMISAAGKAAEAFTIEEMRKM